jgi:hypothetical protein
MRNPPATRAIHRALAALALAVGFAMPVAAQVVLGTAQTYGVLGGSTVTNTGATVITGDLGVSPGSALVGFPPGTRTGATNVANAAALQAQNDVTTAYNALAGRACGTTLTGDLGGRTLVAGVYCFASSAQLTGTLTLDAQGNPNAVFIFQIGSTLTTASNASVVLINGGLACNVSWQVGSSATLGTGTAFQGNILALTSITLVTGASLTGRALARNGAVTLDTNAITVPACAAAPACPAITLTPATLPAAVIGTAYSATLATTGTTALPSTFAATGSLPPGLTLNANGSITGTPTGAGTFNFSIVATDANGCTGGSSLAITVTAAALPLGPQGIPTLSEWALILLAAAIVALGFGRIRRQG